MNYYIELNNNKPINYPITEDNFKQAFPHIDTSNLPDSFARCERTDIPILGVYQIYEGVIYAWVGGIVKELHQVRDMTEEEIAKKQENVINNWKETGFISWTFNENTCEFDPPVPYPTDGNVYLWNEESISWAQLTP